MKKMQRILFCAFLALMGFVSVSYAGPVNLGAPIGATQAADTWYTDRYAPNGWSYDGGSGVLTQTIDASDRLAARPNGFNSLFYDTQGRKYDFADGVTTMSVELYVSGDPLQQRLAGFWGTTVDVTSQISFFPILEFAADGTGPRFQGWNGVAFNSYGLSPSFAYDAWHELRIVLDTTADEFNYLLDGNLLGSVGADGSIQFANVILQGYNKFSVDQGDYSLQWRNLQTGPDSSVPEPGTFALIGIAGLGLVLTRRKTFAKA